MSDAIESLPPGILPVAEGDVLAGKYRVDRILGLGGMGVVVAATHLQLDQRVALKFMLPEALRVPAFVERFAREARAAVRLKSDHVARVLDVGTLASGSPYMVMEYLEGNDLGSIVERQGRMHIDVAVDCVLQACDAVAEAHSIGIVHRDLKPRNLFMTGRNDGRALVKVLDFGISKHKAGSDLALTKTTDVMGSPNYMSPEQLKSAKAVDERSDIWALGVVLYELLSGQVPFVAESVTQLTAMVLMDPPRPIGSLRPDVPCDLVRVVERCLEKSPASRFASVAELALALQPFAPPDSRDLAVRISRIASASRASSLPEALRGGEALAFAPTAVNWSGSGKSSTATSSGRLVARVASLAAVVVAALLVGWLLVARASRTTPISAGRGAAVMVSEGPAVAPPAPILTGLAAATASAITTAVQTASARPVATAATASASSRHASRDRPPAASAPPPAVSATPATGEPPRYRTTW